jgi:hypothetical protein
MHLKGRRAWVRVGERINLREGQPTAAAPPPWPQTLGGNPRSTPPTNPMDPQKRRKIIKNTHITIIYINISCVIFVGHD